MNQSELNKQINENNKIQEEFKKSKAFSDSLLKEAKGLKLHNLEKYTINDSFLKNNDYLASAVKLTDMSKTLNTQIYHHKLDSLHNIGIEPLPEIRNYAQEMLEESKIHNKRFNIVIENLECQNKLLERQITQEQLNSEKQINKLQEQVDGNKKSSAEQGKDNRSAIYITLGVAVISVLVSLYSMNKSVQKTEEIYHKENKSTTLQNTILNNKLDEIKQNTNNQKLIKNIENQTIVLNQILKSIKSDQQSNLKSDQKILLLMKENNNITIKELCEIISMSESGVKKVIKKLKDEDKLIRVGSLKSGHWEVKEICNNGY